MKSGELNSDTDTNTEEQPSQVQTFQVDNTNVDPVSGRHETISTAPKSIVKSSLQETYVNFYKGQMGAGVLGAPYTILMGGWGLAIIMYTIIPFLIVITTLKLIEIVDKEINKPGLGFSQVARALLGEKSINFIKFNIILMQWGTCASYLLFFMQFIEYAVFDSLYVSDTHQFFYFLAALLIIVPLTLIDEFALFARFSIFTVLVLFALVLYSIVDLGNNKQTFQDQIENTFNFQYLPLQAGVALFGFEGIGTIFSIKGSMQDESQFPKVIKVLGFGILFQNLAFSLITSFAFGVNTQQIVLLSLNRSWLASIFQIMYAIALIISFPLQLLPAYQMMEGFTVVKRFVINAHHFCQLYNSTQGYLLRRTAVRLVQTLMIAGFAVSIPQFSILLSFIGGFSAVFLQFGFPFMAYIYTRWGKETLFSRVWFSTSSVIGILLGLFATVSSVIITAQS